MLQSGIEIIANLNEGADYPDYLRGQIDLLLALVGYAGDGYELRAYVAQQVALASE